MEIVKIKKEVVDDLDLPLNVKEVYYLKNELETIGYGFINYDADNEIEIFIKEEYREYENGKKLFTELFNDFDRNEINLRVELSNYPMIKIIEEFNGLNLGTRDGIVKYVIKKN